VLLKQIAVLNPGSRHSDTSKVLELALRVFSPKIVLTLWHVDRIPLRQ
jgi:hypothetical protein